MSLGPLNPRKSGLGSLAQSARSKKLNQARWLLIVIGVLTIVLNAIMIATLRSQVNAAIDKMGIVDAATRQALEDQAVRLGTIVGIFTIVLGAVFIFLGIIVHVFPVPATVIALVLYVGATAAFIVLEPNMWYQGIIFKVIIIVALIQAIVAAVAYQKEENAARQLEPEPEYE
jgi:hypothetical protein